MEIKLIFATDILVLLAGIDIEINKGIDAYLDVVH